MPSFHHDTATFGHQFILILGSTYTKNNLLFNTLMFPFSELLVLVFFCTVSHNILCSKRDRENGVMFLVVSSFYIRMVDKSIFDKCLCPRNSLVRSFAHLFIHEYAIICIFLCMQKCLCPSFRPSVCSFVCLFIEYKGFLRQIKPEQNREK